MHYFRRLAWNGLFRCVCFWLIVFGTIALCDALVPFLDITANIEILGSAVANASAGNGAAAAEAISKPAFATSLAWLLVAAGLGLLAAFLIMHAVAVRLSLLAARRIVAKYKDRKAFANAYDAEVYPRLYRHPLIGHAWKEFDETLLKDEQAVDGVIGNTVRPQNFISYVQARERLTGLKMLGSISGYFVGVGLLLTFIGIVLALGTAGPAVNSGNVEAMQKAMAHLLEIASFKFTTSIAGLGVSIIFAIVAKLIVVWIEGAFTRFSEAVEHQLRYTAPQSITAEMNAVGKEQRDQLKEINSDRYFTKLADVVAPLIGAAMERALSPVTTGIGSAIEQLKATSQSGVSDLLKEFSTSVQGSAGTELRELGETLKQMQLTLSETKRGLEGTGEDFARRMSEAAENLNKLVRDAGRSLEGSAEQNRAGLEEVVSALRETFEKANSRLDADLGNAASGASSKVEEAMGRVMVRLEEQLGALMSGLEGFQASSISNITEVREHVLGAQASAVSNISTASAEVSKALDDGLRGAMQRIADEIDRFQKAMSSGELALSHQASAIGDATSQTRSVADAFARTAQDVRAAAAPLVQSGERVAQASSEMSQAITRSAAGLETANSAATSLSNALTEQIVRLGDMWAGYKEQFDKIDEALANAVGKLAEATDGQSERLTEFARRMDSELANVMTRLQTSIEQISENTTDLATSVEELTKGLSREAAE
ncbi:MAG: hypothetical protein JWQ89_1280 [Devosia sp.]|uniref:anti-phage ZorAB system protein ZorA n=1 Tax=Devosia sp. TaxID=1871048 RepID=UPI0026235C11|nr:anti-phage ZorAB system protein ZorA [Devosia sp.]MDB5539553.1 hypothetical protein [Devosia sp.]